jgi:hypothetical protein
MQRQFVEIGYLKFSGSVLLEMVEIRKLLWKLFPNKE